ncbi:hypothetical protein SAMN02745121_05047 [Nannocystis exedens]|uniref:Uncharacterized protein n=1 Tax=Nannocystis exedens TaxID=54 RepID=A0A1I2CDD1_9BACT|nr:hypothetical protein [Nannocystis exedens]PCC68387.1 hypothetical protein NAEX_01397 [Nannocystis exedens]SFE65833.1 hypothetical protein SAMN02745121_05047 [Nannocystis exedens]
MATPSEPSEPAEITRAAAMSRLVYLLPVIGAPLGMGAAIFASFAIAGWHVTHSAIVQVEPQWVAGEPVAARVQVLDGDGQAVQGAQVEATLRRGEERASLGALRDAAAVGMAQGRLTAPAWAPGPATLELAIAAHEQFREAVEVELVASRAPRRGTATVSGSTKNYADDTEPQPEKLRIVLRPLGRLAAGFENALVARVTDAEGKPRRGPVEVRLLDGEFGSRKASRDTPVVLVRGETDAAGLVRIDGLLATDVVRFEVRALAGPQDMSETSGAKDPAAKDMAVGAGAKGKAGAKGDAGAQGATGASATGTSGAAGSDGSSPRRSSADAAGATGSDAKGARAAGEGAKEPGEGAKGARAANEGAKEPGAAAAGAKDGDADASSEPSAIAARKFRMVSFAGAVTVDATPWTAGVGDALTIKARGLRPKRAVFVDVRGPDGAWVDTLEPPVVGPEPPRTWSSAGLQPGLVQVEAYHFTNAPGESSALARVVLGPTPGQGPALSTLIALQRERLALPRVEKDFDAGLEGKYLDALATASLDPEAQVLAEAWLVGTLPVEIHGPPTALATRGREDADMAALRRLWAGRVRLLLLGGGGLFLAVTTLLIVVSHRGAAERLAREMLGQGPEVAAEVRKAQRAVLWRALGLLASMAFGLVLTAAVLDKLFWQT